MICFWHFQTGSTYRLIRSSYACQIDHPVQAGAKPNSSLKLREIIGSSDTDRKRSRSTLAATLRIFETVDCAIEASFRRSFRAKTSV